MLRNILFSALLFSSPLLAQNSDFNLSGLDKISVYVVMSNEFEEYLSYVLIKTDVELKLRQNGIEVVDSFKNSQASLQVRISGFLSDNKRSYIANIDVSIVEYVRFGWRLQEELNLAKTYVQSMVIKSGINDWEYARNTLKDIVDVFINDYLKDNPK